MKTPKAQKPQYKKPLGRFVSASEAKMESLKAELARISTAKKKRA